MRPIARIFAFHLLLGSFCDVVAGGDHMRQTGLEKTTAELLIEVCVRAHGGPALGEITSERRVGTVLRGVFGKVPFEIVYESPDRWRWMQTFAWGDRIAFGFDGSEGWIQDGNGTRQMSSEQMIDLQLLLDPKTPVKLRELFPGMEISGYEAIGDIRAVRVAAKSVDGVSRDLLFDRDTGLLVGAGDMRFEDYREVNGIQRPFTVLLGRNQGEQHREMKMETTEISADVELEDRVFRSTACSLKPIEAPLYTHRTEIEVGIDALDACVGVYQHPSAPEVTFTVTRQGRHLMFQSTGGGTVEIKPQSETDYYIQFLNLDFHFARDATGAVTHLEMGADRAVRAPKIR